MTGRWRGALAALLLLGVACGGELPADNGAGELVAEAEDLTEALEEARASLVSVQERLASDLLQRERGLEGMAEELAELEEAVADAEDELAVLERRAEALEEDVAELTEERDELRQAVAAVPPPAPEPAPVAQTRSHPGRCAINPQQGDIVCETSAGSYVCRGSVSPSCGSRVVMTRGEGCDQYWNGGRVCGPDRASWGPPTSTGARPADAQQGFVPPSGSSSGTSSSAGIGANCSEERAHGHSNMGRSHPHYRPQFDGDDDGIACET